jgi:ABC-type phosphate/phosphonate transport system substrate-binding protein
MDTQKSNHAPAVEAAGSASSGRRHALRVLLGASCCLPAARAARDESPDIRLAISESLVSDVNLNDARAAMLVWIKRISQDMNLPVEYNPKVFDSTLEILTRVRQGKVDAVALNILEYRQISGLLDPNYVVTSDDKGRPQYVLLVKREGPIQKLADLKGRRLLTLKAPLMCIAPAWLSTLLAADGLEQGERFFAGIASDAKVSGVVLPVFFGQAQACLTTKKGYATMCELNPQVGKQLRELAVSPEIIVTAYLFRKSYQGPYRERMSKALANLRESTSGRQLMTLFQFDSLIIRDTNCLASAMTLLDAAERVRRRLDAGGRKG